MNIEEIEVSACRGAFDKNTTRVNLVHWLENVRPPRHVTEYEKKQLPAIMPHGIFITRRQDSIWSHTGLVQVDIDAKHQSGGFDAVDLVKKLQSVDCLVAGGLSCSGAGVYMLIAVDDITPVNHTEKAGFVINMIQKKFGVTVDCPVSNNLSSLRFASGYPPFVNYNATPVKFQTPKK